MFVKTRDLFDLVNACHARTDKDSTRFALGAVKLELDEKILRGIGTDGRTMAVVEIEVTLESDESFQHVHVDMRGLWKLRDRLPQGKNINEASIRQEKSGALVVDWISANGKRTYSATCEPMEGRYPNWQQVFPTDEPTGTAEIAPDQWVEATKESESEATQLSLNGSAIAKRPKLELESKNHTGDDIELNLDWSYLTDHLARIRGNFAQVEYRGNMRPILIRSHLTRFLQMPMAQES